MRRGFVIGAIAVLALTGCGGGGEGGWPQSEKDAFMQSCTGEGSALGGDVDAYCQCALDGITTKWTYDEFRALENSQDSDAGNEMMQIITDCMGEL